MNEDTLTIRTQQVNETCVSLVLAGRLDAKNAPTVKETLTQFIERGNTHLIVDLAQVPFIDSAGLAALVSALKSTRRVGGNVLLSSVQPQARTVFSLTMLDQVFGIHPSIEAAVDSLATSD
jgi:anti-sigma B factor antagonist